MSRTVHKKGTLKWMSPKLGESLEEQCRRIVGVEISDYWNSYVEYMNCECENYVIHNNYLYKMINVVEIDEEEDIFQAAPNGDGTISFEVKFYNGGCSMDEALKMSLERMD